MTLITDVLKKPEANAFFSFVVGLGIAALLFHRARKEYTVPAIETDELLNSIQKKNGKCYRFRITDAADAANASEGPA